MEHTRMKSAMRFGYADYILSSIQGAILFSMAIHRAWWAVAIFGLLSLWQTHWAIKSYIKLVSIMAINDYRMEQLTHQTNALNQELVHTFGTMPESTSKVVVFGYSDPNPKRDLRS